MMKYYYEITKNNGEVFYVKIGAQAKSPEKLCEFLKINGTAREISKEEYEENTEE